MTPQELETAIAAAQAGREEGYRQLFSGFSQVVFRLVSRMIPDTGEAEELTQDVFLKAFGALGDFRQQGAGFGAWICRIAYRMAISSLRHSGRVQVPAEKLENIDAADEADEWMQEIGEALTAAIGRLPEEEQTLLHLFYYEDLPLREIAYITSANVPLVATRLSRIRKRLRKELENT